MGYKPNRTCGFTLVELLVVVVSAVIVLVVILPGMSRARGQSKNAICSANLKLYGRAMYAYVGDNNLVFPASIGALITLRAGVRACMWHNPSYELQNDFYFDGQTYIADVTGSL